MSAYTTDSIHASGKSYQTSSHPSSAAAAPAPASTYASSAYSDASYCKDTYASTPKTSSSMKSAITSWTKELVADMGKPPTSRYDAAQAASSSLPASHGASIGAPYWSNVRPGKI